MTGLPELRPEELQLIDRSRVARVATLGADGSPHVVPICPALDGQVIVIASLKDGKVRDLRHDPRTALSFDEYSEDWDALLQVLVRGSAEVVEHGPMWTRGRDLLYEKFPQYEPKAEILEGESVILRVTPTWITSSWRHKGSA